MNHQKSLKYQLAGWILFVICAVFFMASGIQNGDMLTFAGSVVFFIACWLFLIPLIDSLKKGS